MKPMGCSSLESTIGICSAPSSLIISSSSAHLSSSSIPQSVARSITAADESKPVSSTSESPKTKIQPPSKPDMNDNTTSPRMEFGSSTVEGNLELKPSVSSPPSIETSTRLSFGDEPSLIKVSPAAVVASRNQTWMNETASPKQNVTVNAQQEQPSTGHSPFPNLPTTSRSVTSGIDGLDVQNAEEDDMDEETLVTSRGSELSLGSLGGFGLGSAPKPNAFGGSFGNAQTNVTSLFSRPVPSGELFQPASFNFQSLQRSQSSQPANSGAFAGDFGTSTTVQAPIPSGFGQPAQVGPGQQALRLVLGAFGQLRRLGTSLSGTGFGSPGGFGGGIAGVTPTVGFTSAAAGGFAGFASGGGGFARLVSGGGGSTVAASGGSGSGFAAAASGNGGFSGAVLGGVGFGGAHFGEGGFGGVASGGGFGAGMNETASPKQNVTVNAQQEQPSFGHSPFPNLPTTSGSVTSGIYGLDVQNAEGDDMDEETLVTSRGSELSLGSLGGFGLGSALKPNTFGGSFGNAQTNATSLFSRLVPSGELFQPASFNFQSLQPSQSSQPANTGVFAGGFGTSTTVQALIPSGFGQPAQVGPGQQALRSVLGAFGQLRRLGTSLPGIGFGSPGGFGGGIAGVTPTVGFTSAAAGGFAGFASGGGGFARLVSGGGGSAVAASGGSGNGFAAAASGSGGFSGAVLGGVGFGGAPFGEGGFGGAASGGGFGAGMNETASPKQNVTVNAQQEQPSVGHSSFPNLPTTSGSVTSGINGLDVQNADEDDMDEETLVISRGSELSLGSLGGFGLSSAPKPNTFGGSFGNAQTNATSLFSRPVPSGELFQPASFNFQSLQPSQSSQLANSGVFAGGFGTSTTVQALIPCGFGQPTQVGPGQQALRSVLGVFGQLRRLGTSLPGIGFGSPDGFGGGIAGVTPTVGFTSAATGGFAGFASNGGGFASLASGGGGSGGGFATTALGSGGFSSAVSGGVGFGGASFGEGGFGGAASSGGGFGAFNGQQVSGGFSTFAGAASGGDGFASLASGGGQVLPLGNGQVLPSGE